HSQPPHSALKRHLLLPNGQLTSPPRSSPGGHPWNKILLLSEKGGQSAAHGPLDPSGTTSLVLPLQTHHGTPRLHGPRPLLGGEDPPNEGWEKLSGSASLLVR